MTPSYLLWQLPKYRQDIKKQAGCEEGLDHVPEGREQEELVGFETINGWKIAEKNEGRNFKNRYNKHTLYFFHLESRKN